MSHHGRATRAALALVLAIGQMLSGCATTPGKPAEPALERITTTGDGETARVVIKGSRPLEYTAFRLSGPPRIVVDIPGVAIERVAGSHPSESPLVREVTASEVREGPSRVARVEIAAEPGTGFTVTPDAQAHTLTVELTAPPETVAPAPTLDATAARAAPAAQPAGQGGPVPDLTAPAAAALVQTGTVDIRAITPRAVDSGTEILIEASGPISRYEVFRLPRPRPRLVVDVTDARNRVPKRRIPVADSRVEAVRLGSHGSRVRVVLDLAGRGDSPYEVTPDPKGLRVTLGPRARTAAAGPSPAPAVPAGTPSPAPAVAAGIPWPEAPSAPAAPAPVVGRPGDGGLPSPRRPALAPAGFVRQPFVIRDSGKRYTGRRLSLDFKDADIDNVLRLIAEISNLNIVTSDDVKGKISLRLVNVPWDQALDIVLETQGLGMVRTGNVVRIAPAAKLKSEDEAALAAKAAKQKLEDLYLEIIPVNYADASDMEKQVKGLLSDRGKVTVDKRTNALIVSDVRESLDQAKALIAALDTVTPQVLIEARIVEASLDFAREIGVQWGGTFTASAATGNPTGYNFPGRIDVTGGAGNDFAVNLPAAAGEGSGGAINFALGSLTNFLNLDLRLSALERTGEGRIISSPRVTTLDNKEAVIEQGISIPFETTSQSGTQTTFIDANLNLTVTPHVTNDESINLKIKASKNAPDPSVRGASGAPSIAKKEAKTEVLIKNGQTTVIGGIYQIDRSDTVSGVPWFRKLPLVGWLFKKTSVVDKKTELLIFITPRIVRPMQHTASR